MNRIALGMSRAVLTLSPGTRSPPRRYHCLGDPVSFYDANTSNTKMFSTECYCDATRRYTDGELSD